MFYVVFFGSYWHGLAQNTHAHTYTHTHKHKHQEVIRLHVYICQHGLIQSDVLSLVPLRNNAICYETDLQAIAMLLAAAINQIPKFTSNVKRNI
jgi:hypothetical protein